MNATRLKICSVFWALNQNVSLHVLILHLDVQIPRLNEDRVRKPARILINV